MQYRLIPPVAALSLYIKQYWFLEMDSCEGVGKLQRVVPNGFMELTFHFADHLRKIKFLDELQPGIIISGQKTGFFDVVPTGKTQMLSIQFYPHSAGLFFDLPIHELSDETIDLQDILGQIARELEEQLHDLSTLEQRINHIERFLLGRLGRKPEYAWNRIVNNIKLINQSNGTITVKGLANAACLSHKQHERVFRQFVGLSPKQYLKVIRFQYTLFEHQQHPNESLTQLAYSCGYYDLSHMINDFRDLSGITPRQYFMECDEPISDYF